MAETSRPVCPNGRCSIVGPPRPTRGPSYLILTPTSVSEMAPLVDREVSSAGQAGGDAAVDGDDGPGDVRGAVGREERGKLGHFLGLTSALQRRASHQCREAFGCTLAAGHRRLDEAGADGVGPDALLAVLDG